MTEPTALRRFSRILIRVFTSLALAAAPLPLLAQDMMVSPCFRPGTSFIESWSASGNPCGVVAASSCQQPWSLGTGSVVSLTASPSGAAPGSFCPQSLEINQPASSNYYVYTALASPIPAGDFGDVWLGVNVKSQALPSGSINQLFSISQSASGGTNTTFRVFFKNAAGVFSVYASGNSDSPTIPISVGSPHVIHIKCAVGACSIQVDGGATEGFVENSEVGTILTVGDFNNAVGQIDFQVGVMSISLYYTRACALSQYPQSFTDFHSGTAGNAPTAASLAADSYGTGTYSGIWSVNGAAVMTYASDELGPLASPIVVCGQTLSGNSPMSLKNNVSGNTGSYLQFNPLISAPAVSMSFLWEPQLTIASGTNYFYDLGEIYNGPDYVVVQAQITNLGAETLNAECGDGTGGGNTPINVTNGSVYQIDMRYVAGGTHNINVYPASGGAALANWSCAHVAGSGIASSFRLGKVGSEPPQTSGYWLTGNWQIGYVATAIKPFL